MGNALDVVCIGNLVVDALGINANVVPDEGCLALFDRVELHLGGCANNMAIALARLGMKVGLAAKVGVDGLGDFCASVLTEKKVDVRGLKRSKSDSTSFSFILLPKSGNRRIIHTLAANATFSPDDIDASLFQGAKWVSVNGLALLPSLEGKNLAKVLQAARKAGARTAADTAINDRFTAKDWHNLLAPSYELLDVLIPSEVEAKLLTGHTDPEKICSTLRSRGVKIAGVKLGNKGSVVLSDEGFFKLPIYKVKCVDTTGAGDCFMAGFIAGMLKGYTAAQAAALGNAVSAHCVQAVGATSGIPSLEKVLAFQKAQT
jgi:sugar/nucleoside kinase (ribokinase family)